MKLFRKAKISWQLTLWYAVFFAVTLFVLNISIFAGVKYFLIEQAKQQIEHETVVITGMIEEWRDILQGDLVEKSKLDGKHHIQIVDSSGQVYFTSHDFHFPAISPDALDRPFQLLNDHSIHFLYHVAPLKLENQIIYLQISRDMNDEYRLLDMMLILMGVLSFISVIISVIAGFWVSRQILNMIKEITEVAQQISATDLNRRIEVSQRDDELSRLGNTFNDMIGRLHAAFERQNQFVSDVSHEFRTPLAIIRGYSDIIEQWGFNDREVFVEAMRAIKKELQNMSELLEKLLCLAKYDHDDRRLDKTRFRLDELLAELVTEYRLLAPEHMLTFSSEGKEIEICADRGMLTQLFRALIDNSVKYTAKHGSIKVGLRQEETTVRIIIRDNGIGIPRDELPRIFNRFYRVDKTRSKETGGSGLGLYLAQRIVRAHAGIITIDSTFGKGTIVEVTLPMDLRP